MYIKPLKSEINLCLNCEKISCNYGTCEYFRENGKNFYIICIRKLKDGTKEKRYFICFAGKCIRTKKWEFEAPMFTKKEAVKMLKKIREQTKLINSNSMWTLEMNV